MFSRTNMRFPNLFLCDIIAPWSSQAILFTFLFHEGDLKSSAGRVWVTRPALFVFTCLPVRPASRKRSVPVSHPYRRRCARPSRYAHQRSDRARTAAHRRPTLRRKIAAQKNKRHTFVCLLFSGASGDTELFEKARNINGFQGGRVANNLYISPFRATVFKTAALFLYLNSSVVIRVRKPLFFPL